MSQLKDRYKKEIIPALVERMEYKNVMQVPRLEKIVLNIGLGEAIANAKALEAGEADLTAITGQHPVITRSKRSISRFPVESRDGYWRQSYPAGNKNVGFLREIGHYNFAAGERVPGSAAELIRRPGKLYSGF